MPESLSSPTYARPLARQHKSLFDFVWQSAKTIFVLLAAYLAFWLVATLVEHRAKPDGFGSHAAISFQPLTALGQPSPRLGPQTAIYKAPYRFMSWLWDKDIAGGRVIIAVPRYPAGVPLGLMLSARSDVLAVRLNGREIMPDFRYPRLVGAFASEPSLYRFPAGLRSSNADHLELDIRRSLRDPIIFPDYTIAPIESLSAAFQWRNFMSVEAPLTSIVLSMFSILLFVMIAGPDTEKNRNLTFIGTLLLMALSSLVFLMFDQRAYSMAAYIAIITVISFGLGICAAYFAYIESKIRFVSMTILQNTLIVLLLVSVIVSVSNYTGTREHFLAFNIYITGQLFSTGALAIAAAILAWEIARDGKVRLVERFALIICFGAIALDRSQPGLFTVHSPFVGGIPLSLQWIPLVGSIVGFAMVFVLAKHAETARGKILSANARLEHRLAEREAQLREVYVSREKILAEQVTSEERQRIMRDMHDGLGSNIMSMLLAARRGEAEPARVAEGLQSVIDEMRLLIDSMDSVGESLGSAFAMFRERVQPRVEEAGMKFTWQDRSSGPVPELGPREVLQVFRIMQEAVTNALKHSGGEGLTVAISGSAAAGQSLRIAICDDGAGLGKANPRGRGMESMAARAASLGGQLDVRSGADGVQVLLDLPQR